jgi:hypothetical protein
MQKSLGLALLMGWVGSLAKESRDTPLDHKPSVPGESECCGGSQGGRGGRRV